MTQIRIGTSGWTYAHWRGVFYPERLRSAEWLRFYAGQFDACEINGTFYRLPSEAAVVGWAAAAPPGFLFAWKVSRYLTHTKRLKDPAESLALIEGSISVLRHAAWAVDELSAAEAIEAGRVAKIYCARAALTVCETSIQVHGGIGNTWECLAHVYLRRVLTATELWPVKLEELSIGFS